MIHAGHGQTWRRMYKGRNEMGSHETFLWFQTSHYERQVNAALRQNRYRNAGLGFETPRRQTLGKVIEATQGALCRYGLLERTAICQDNDI